MKTEVYGGNISLMYYLFLNLEIFMFYKNKSEQIETRKFDLFYNVMRTSEV